MARLHPSVDAFYRRNLHGSDIIYIGIFCRALNFQKKSFMLIRNHRRRNVRRGNRKPCNAPRRVGLFRLKIQSFGANLSFIYRFVVFFESYYPLMHRYFPQAPHPPQNNITSAPNYAVIHNHIFRTAFCYAFYRLMRDLFARIGNRAYRNLIVVQNIYVVKADYLRAACLKINFQRIIIG